MTHLYFMPDFVRLELPLPEDVDSDLSYKIAKGFAALTRLKGFEQL